MTKQYLLICDEPAMEKLRGFFGPLNVEFLEVQGMNVAQGNVNVLVTPILPPVNPMPMPVMPTPPPASPDEQATMDSAPNAS